ncbi:MAG: dTDP-4-dehydrorhamnose reductase [Bdellovibrionia bacterium]
MRYLIFGAGGGLGQAFMKNLGSDAIGFTHAECDVTDANAVSAAFERIKPRVVINASGYTAVDKAEIERDRAIAVNATGVDILARECVPWNIPFVTFSTDYVFSGEGSTPLTETDPIDPRSVYGQSKAAGETLALQNPTALVIRTSWLYSENGKSFPRSILTKTLASEIVKVVDDQQSSPTFSPDLVEATLTLLDRGAKGLFHFSSSGVTNWNAFAAEAIRIMGTLTGQTFPEPAVIKTSDLKLAAPRPAYSALSCEKARQEGVRQRSWQAALADFAERLKASGTL